MDMTLKSIDANLMNAVEQSIPANPETVLLEIAFVAARAYAGIQYRLMQAARDGSYVSTDWHPDSGEGDVHEFNEARWFDADRRAASIAKMLGIPYDD